VSFLVLALGITTGNVWIAAARSTIPVQLEEEIANKEMRREKHPGRDDVYLLRLESGKTLQVDGAVFDAVNVGESISKQAWSKQLVVEGRTIEMKWSSDLRGMLWAMPAIWVALAATAFFTLHRQQSDNDK
jgi:hypothetical protein